MFGVCANHTVRNQSGSDWVLADCVSQIWAERIRSRSKPVCKQRTIGSASGQHFRSDPNWMRIGPGMFTREAAQLRDSKYIRQWPPRQRTAVRREWVEKILCELWSSLVDGKTKATEGPWSGSLTNTGTAVSNVNGRWWKLQVGSKEQQTSHSQRFLILFLLFFWMVHTGGRCYSLSPSLALTYSDVS